MKGAPAMATRDGSVFQLVASLVFGQSAHGWMLGRSRDAVHERLLNGVPDPTAPVGNRTARAPPTASRIHEVGSSRLKRRDRLESVDQGVEHETRLGGGRVLNHERVADNPHSECLHSGQGARKCFATHSEL